MFAAKVGYFSIIMDMNSRFWFTIEDTDLHRGKNLYAGYYRYYRQSISKSQL